MCRDSCTQSLHQMYVSSHLSFFFYQVICTVCILTFQLFLVDAHDKDVETDHYPKTIFLPFDGNIRAPSFSFSFFFASHDG